VIAELYETEIRSALTTPIVVQNDFKACDKANTKGSKEGIVA
jgi:hypothetical protein